MKKVSFCAVAGNGMSALAQILRLKGYEVSGSDLYFDQGRDTDRKKALSDVGIKIFPQDGSGITDDVCKLYISSIIDDNNPDVKAAKAKNIPIEKRSDLLAEIFHQYSHNIAVGGTSGKSTTTAMIGYILNELGLKPCMINGGFLKNYPEQKGMPNYIYNEGDICVIEADESDGSIRKYHPYIGLINNISHDHKPMETLIEYFEDFASHVQHALVVNYDCPYASKIKHHKKTFSYSLKDSHADIFAYNIDIIPNGVKYSIDGKSFKLNILGRYNVANALAAISVCTLLGIDKFDAARALENFQGIRQRMEFIGTSASGVTVYCDFAHNPQKIEASLSTLKEYPGRLIVMYLSHTPFSARNTGEEDGAVFARTLSDDDILIMPEIFQHIPNPDEPISAADLIETAKKHGVKNAFFLETMENVRQFVLDNAKPGDRVVIMGAHDNSLPYFSEGLVKDL